MTHLTPHMDWVAALLAGGTVSLAPGTYTWPRRLALPDGLVLRGAGADATRLVGFSAQAGGAVTLEGLTLEGHPAGDPGLLLFAAATILECVWRGFTGPAVIAAGAAGLNIEGGRFVDNESSGLHLTDAATGLVRRCLFERHGGAGILVDGQAAPELESNLLLDNADGLRYGGRSAGLAYGNLCQGNARAGIAVGQGASPTLAQNTLRGNALAGLLYTESGGGRATGNDCDGNGRGDIVVVGGAGASFRGNRGLIEHAVAQARDGLSA